MNNENKEFFIKDIKTNISEEDIILAPPTELFEEAKNISQNTQADEKFPFMLQYDSNEKEFLLSILQTAGAIVENDDEEGHILATMMNMTQLAFIKRLDCVERVRTNEGSNPFLMDEEVYHDTVAPKTIDETPVDTVGSQIAEVVQPEQVMTHAVDESVTVVEQPVASNADDGIAVACVGGSSSSCNCPTNTDMQSAQEIQVERSVRGYICCPGAEQWFKFTVPQTKQYTIYTSGSLDTVGTLYDCLGKYITKEDDGGGKINFRIVRTLSAGAIYYVRVRLADNYTGNYTVRVTDTIFPNYVTINKDKITLVKGVTYELPITPNYTYKGYNGAQRIPGLSVSINPSNAYEQKIWWNEGLGDVLECSSDRDDDGDLYIHVTAKGNGTAKLYAEDWKQYGERDECEVQVKTWPEHAKPTIYSRDEWGAREVVADRLVARERDPERIVFHHTAKKFSSTNLSDIKAEIRRVQDLQMDDEEYPKCDIAYHFVIDPAGGIWEGAMVDEYQRGHAEGHFDDIGVVLLGDFEKRLPNLWMPNTLNEKQKNSMKELSKWLCYEYNLPIDKASDVSPITTHKDASGGTECPGDNAEPWVKNDLKNYINDWQS